MNLGQTSCAWGLLGVQNWTERGLASTCDGLTGLGAQRNEASDLGFLRFSAQAQAQAGRRRSGPLSCRANPSRAGATGIEGAAAGRGTGCGG